MDAVVFYAGQYIKTQDGEHEEDEEISDDESRAS
jgi:hypothetical protein